MVMHKPIQYSLGDVSFYGYPIKVTPDVLIPRPETEQLIEKILADFPVIARNGERSRTTTKQSRSPRPYGARDDRVKILEIGTGSGCIAITLAKELPHAQIVATEISKKALKVAQENARLNQVEDRIEFVQADLFPEKGEFDLIVSNPPYIATPVLKTLDPEVRDWEPHLALDGGPDGLKYYRAILARIGEFLRPGGLLALEIGDEQGSSVRELVQHTGLFQEIEIQKDYAGRDRMCFARLQS